MGCPEDVRTSFGDVVKTSLGSTFAQWVLDGKKSSAKFHHRIFQFFFSKVLIEKKSCC